MSILRPDAFAQAQRALPQLTTYVTRAKEDGRWVDWWMHNFNSQMLNGSCAGNFSMAFDVVTGEPVSDVGPNACAGGTASTHFSALRLGPSDDRMFTGFNFTKCKPMPGMGALLASAPAHVRSMVRGLHVLGGGGGGPRSQVLGAGVHY
eukprot:TRINITY_DN888_c1_g1_i1.p3 TRINITY_DN888_c1_g1~~TRINITY_DN888_c1_g1_i1.p3  ORF type:complete len:149 (+),score=24.82 TRINITY_DN888_c1_g1_i1:334-780(+)